MEICSPDCMFQIPEGCLYAKAEFINILNRCHVKFVIGEICNDIFIYTFCDLKSKDAQFHMVFRVFFRNKIKRDIFTNEAV